MSDHSLLDSAGVAQHCCLNAFIAAHDFSNEEGVRCFRLRGGSNKPDYVIFHDTRTHPLALFTNGHKSEIMHNSESEARKKLFFSLRDKWNEAERFFVPRKWRTPETWKANATPDVSITELGLLRIENNKPVFSIWPQFCIYGNPILTLMLRIPQLFNWLSRQPIITELMMESTKRPQDAPRSNQILRLPNMIAYIEEQEGQGPLESIGFRRMQIVSATDLCPKITSVIPFQPFEIQDPNLTTILTVEEFISLVSEPSKPQETRPQGSIIFPPYAIIRNTQRAPLTYREYTLHAWTNDDYISVNELYSDNIVVRQLANSAVQSIQRFNETELLSASFLLYSLSPLSPAPSLGAGEIARRTEGTYTSPLVDIHPSSVVPFREPMSCTAITIEELKDSDFPFIAQPKLDGNRILVHITDIVHDEGAPPPNTKYYSRNGNVQSAKFNQHFDRDIIAFSFLLSRIMGDTKEIQLDCECYAHDVVHAEIGGWINRIAISDEFRQLKLYLLSWIDLEELTTEKKRGRNYTIGSTTFEYMLIEESEMIYEMLATGDYPTIGLNPSAFVPSREDVFSLMGEAVDAGFEGLVLYPSSRPYTFANAGLKKIKKFYDGECTVLSYKASETDPGAIGSVFVRTTAFFAKPRCDATHESREDDESEPPFVTFYVTAALKQELKSGSMSSPYFASCIGKDFTIICGSFSDTGVPIHARFKASLEPGNARLDHK